MVPRVDIVALYSRGRWHYHWQGDTVSFPFTQDDLI